MQVLGDEFVGCGWRVVQLRKKGRPWDSCQFSSLVNRVDIGTYPSGGIWVILEKGDELTFG